ncbi:NAD(P)-dependent oxidoreductase [Sulfitobacter sp. F26169L]|uniref:L-threonate dehydrogenase n=1 Tax=Sulfitobacter sp. F26169L TaxID=2996015 RepID=UPI0022609413|nr:L-threonate dehydrogenase [Sulfitobacter sp. F26169L]MCX7567890.1 NAD(P)-dependent oxidoreductase [Sulfitobacter sp. F26169L]
MLVDFVGLGSMGLGMAVSLVRAGHIVRGYDPDTARVDMLCAQGGSPFGEDDAQADALVSVVLNADQTRAVLFGDQDVSQRLRATGVILSCATVSPAFAAEMEAVAKARGFSYLDAPISGGAIKAAAGQLSIMASGSADAFTTSAPLLEAMAETVHRLGDHAGAGSAMKAVNQLLAGVHIAAMGEAMAFGASQGLDAAQVVEVISASAGTSWMFENRAPHVVEGDYTPRSKVDIWLKDLGIVGDIAAASGLPVPISANALAQFRAASEAGLGQEDDAAIAKYFARQGGVKLVGDS